MKKKVIDTIRKTLYIKSEEITENTLMSEIAKDSMDLIELVAVFSDEFKIKVLPTELSKIKTVKDIIDYIEKYQEQSSHSSLDSF